MEKELSKETIAAVKKSRKQAKKGKTIGTKELKRKLGI